MYPKAVSLSACIILASFVRIGDNAKNNRLGKRDFEPKQNLDQVIAFLPGRRPFLMQDRKKCFVLKFFPYDIDYTI